MLLWEPQTYYFLFSLNFALRKWLATSSSFSSWTARKVIFQMTDYTSIFSTRVKTRTSWKLTSPSFQQTGCACHLDKLALTEPRVTENYELEFLSSIFRNNGHSWKQIQWVFSPLARTTKPSTKPTLITFLPCVQTTDSIISILSQHNNKDVGLLPPQISSFLCPVMDINWRCQVYAVSPVSLARVYLGQTSLSRWSERASLAYPAQTTRNIASGQATIQSQIITSNSRTLTFSLPNPCNMG